MINMFLQAGASGQQGGGLSMWIMLILIFAVMWLFMIRPQRKQQKEMEQFRSSLKKGDKVITAGGIYGTIADVKENERFVILKVDNDTRIKVDKSSLQKDPSVTISVEVTKSKETATEPAKEQQESAKDDKGYNKSEK